MSKYKKGDRFEIKIGEPIKTDGATLYRVGNFDSMVMTDFALDTFKRINRHDCKYDCSKALDYTHEQARMHKDVKSHEVNCESCPLYDIEKPRGCDCPETQERIDVLQAWSDSHPEEVEHGKTLKEDFLEKFPDAERNSDGNPKVNPCDIYGEENIERSDIDCGKCCERVLEYSAKRGEIMRLIHEDKITTTQAVVHAHFERTDNPSYCECSNCGATFSADIQANYCPHCGSRIYEEEP